MESLLVRFLSLCCITGGYKSTDLLKDFYLQLILNPHPSQILSPKEIHCRYMSLHPAVFSEFSSKTNVSNSFKTLPMSNSSIFFLWFEKWDKSNRKAMVSIFILLEWIKLKKTFSTPLTPPVFLLTLHHFSGCV